MPEWYNLSPEEALERLDASPLGLHHEDAAHRLERYGPNELIETRRISPLRIFLSQFLDFMVIILLIAAAISAFIGYFNRSVEEYYDAVVIMVIVGFNAVFGFVQEYRAEKAIKALKAMAAPQATVIRDGETKTIPAKDVVPGDIVVLAAGTKVPADCRLIQVVNLHVNEASLTGESVPVAKSVDPVEGEVFLGDRRNMAFMGSTVESGRGRGVITATGMNTELGNIAGMVQEEEPEETPLQRKLARMGKQIGAGILGISAVIFFVGYLQDPDLIVQMFLTAVSLAVAAIPEGLPAVVTISLALGLQRMVKRHALVRRLPAVETLGSATVICSDKTGTLTEGKMNIREIHAGGRGYEVRGEGFSPEGKFYLGTEEVDPQGEADLMLFLRAGVLCNDSALVQEGGAWTIRGDSTEGTLVVAAMRAKLSKDALDEEAPRVAEFGFTSERKRMTTVHGGDKPRVYMKGAPEVVLERSSRWRKDGETHLLEEEDREAILKTNHALASNALRVLAVAYKDLPEADAEISEEEAERDLVFLGLAGMIDAPRPDAIAAVEECKIAGIRAVMITGDHVDTAAAIAREMKIMAEGDEALTGRDLERLTDEELAERAEHVAVYARVSPEHKVRIVNALKAKGHIVAMTGDGVNDAPALKRSDIGVAMGITGTDVAKESAEMVLTDDNFASIVKAVEEGRAIYDNIRKFVAYLLSANGGEVLVMFVATLLLFQEELLPFFSAIQLLWINLVTDGFPALALGVDPPAQDIMERPPLDPEESPISRDMFYMIILVSAVILLGTLGLFWWEYFQSGTDVRVARTMAFTLVVVFELYFVFSVRSPRRPIWKSRGRSNRGLWVAVLLSLLLQAAVIYVPALQGVFETAPLGIAEWVKVAAVGATVLVAVEAWKAVRYRA
jgi:Ca2+-transporting ATPase